MVTTSGYPDYQRLQSQSGDIISTFGITNNASYSWGVFDTHGYGYINVSVNAIGATSYMTITLSWATDSEGVQQVCTYQFIPTPGGQQTLQIPCTTRYVEVLSNWIAGPKTDVPLFAMFGANVPAAPSLNSQPGQPYIWGQASIAAGGNQIFAATTTVQGSGILSITDTGNNKWYATLNFYDSSTASFQSMAAYFGAQLGQGNPSTIAIPPTPLQVQVFNQDTVAHTFFVSVGVLG